MLAPSAVPPCGYALLLDAAEVGVGDAERLAAAGGCGPGRESAVCVRASAAASWRRVRGAARAPSGRAWISTGPEARPAARRHQACRRCASSKAGSSSFPPPDERRYEFALAGPADDAQLRARMADGPHGRRHRDQLPPRAVLFRRLSRAGRRDAGDEMRGHGDRTHRRTREPQHVARVGGRDCAPDRLPRGPARCAGRATRHAARARLPAAAAVARRRSGAVLHDGDLRGQRARAAEPRGRARRPARVSRLRARADARDPPRPAAPCDRRARHRVRTRRARRTGARSSHSSIERCARGSSRRSIAKRTLARDDSSPLPRATSSSPARGRASSARSPRGTRPGSGRRTSSATRRCSRGCGRCTTRRRA